MSDIPGDLKFLSSHEWARVGSDGAITIGISEHAQDLLGDIVFVELPEVGHSVDAESGMQCLKINQKLSILLHMKMGGSIK